jgi:hypothetical protein
MPSGILYPLLAACIDTPGNNPEQQIQQGQARGTRPATTQSSNMKLHDEAVTGSINNFTEQAGMLGVMGVEAQTLRQTAATVTVMLSLPASNPE